MKRFVLNAPGHGEQKTQYSLDYRALLNEQQYRAVFHTEGPALVIAGAGTGKTRTLIHRMARLIESGIPPENILLLTFTRRAAGEMLNRSQTILDNRCLKIKAGTFHHYCCNLLRRYATLSGFDAAFTVLDTPDAVDTLHIVRKQMNISRRKGRFPTTKTILTINSKSINKGKPIVRIMEVEYPQFLHYKEEIRNVLSAYEEYKQDKNLMDFDDLLRNTVFLLENNESILKRIAGDHIHVMVDEFQDINPIQAILTRLFSSVHQNVMVVGDDAQSIYSFRGADHHSIMSFMELYPKAKMIKLEKNYRSTQPILNLANTLLDRARHKYEKKLFTERKGGERPALVKAESESKQSRFVTQLLLQLREEGYSLNDSAVLFRNGRDSYDLEVELNRNNIPFIKYGGQKLTEAAHVKDVLAHIRVVVNRNDIVAWNRTLMLLDGIGPKTAFDLYESLQKREEGEYFEISGDPSYYKQLNALEGLLKDIETLACNPPLVISKINAYYKAYCKKRYDDYPKRLKDIEALKYIAEDYQDLTTLLEELTLDPIQISAIDTEKTEAEENPLILSTIHSAKGLEWKNVFIIQCLDGIIPSGYAIEDENQLEEELRLLYVACTRAAEHLFISYPVLQATSYGDYFTKPSRFIDDISEDILEPWILVEEQSHAPQNGDIDQLKS